MGNYEQLKQAIAEVIKTNGNEEITGIVLQNVLLNLISTIGANATFRGIATPETSPGVIDENVFYIATESGVYPNFNAYEVTEPVLFVNRSGGWSVDILGVQNSGETMLNYVKSIFKKPGNFNSQVFNGATIDLTEKTLTIPSGQTGSQSTFEALADKIDGKRVYIAFLVKATGDGFGKFTFYSSPIEAKARTFIIQKDIRLYVAYIDGNVGSLDFDVFLQKNNEAVTQETKLECVDLWTWSEPIGVNASQDEQILLIRELIGLPEFKKEIQKDIFNNSIVDNSLIIPVTQLFNGAQRDGNKLKIPIGQTGESSTFELSKPEFQNKNVVLNARIKITNAVVSDFLVAKIPFESEREIITISDNEIIVKQNFSGNTNWQGFSIFLQKNNSKVYTDDVFVEVLETSYFESPTNNDSLYNPFPINLIDKKINDSIFVYKKDNEITQRDGEIFNGAIWIENGFRIPTGQNGASSYIRQRFNILPSVKSKVQFLFNTGGIEIGLFDIRLNMLQLPKVIDGLGNNIYKITIDIPDSITDAEAVITLQKGGTDLATQNIDVTISNVLYFSNEIVDDKQVSQILIDQKIKEIQDEEIEVKVVTCSVTGIVGVDADFIGRNCIQDAIDSITDATTNNRYRVYVKNGYYYVMNSSEYKGYPGYPCMILMKDFVELVGESENGVVIHAELPFEDSEIDTGISRYMHQTMYNWAEWGNVRNLTLVAKNIRYTIHMDSGNAAYKTREYENVTVVFEGTKGYLRCFGLGTVSGEVNVLKNVKMISKTGDSFSCHNNTKFDKQAIYKIENCYFDKGLEIQNNGALQDCIFDFVGCRIPDLLTYNDLWLKGNPAQKQDSFNHAETKVTGTGNTPVMFENLVEGLSLMFKTKTIGSGGSIDFDINASAFDLLIKDPNFNIGAPINPKRSYFIKNGFNGFEGSNGCRAFAFGRVDVTEVIAAYDDGVNYRSIGKRLGNCTTENKTLTVIIDGTPRNIVFNKDYTALTNSQILADITTVIGAYADVSLYSYGREYYHEFTDCVIMGYNSGADFIPKGTFVKITGRNIEIANSWDNVGVTLDDIPIQKTDSISSTYGSGRVLVKGILPNSLQNTTHFFRAATIPNVGDKLEIINGIANVSANGEQKVYKQGLILIGF